MSMAEPDSRLEAWERWEQPALAILPYVMLTVAVAISLITRRGPWAPIDWTVIGLAAAAAGLLALFTARRAIRDRPPLLAVYFTALALVMFALVVTDPWFGFFTFTGYFYAYYLPNGKWRLLGVATIALITGTSQNGGLPHHGAGSVAVWAVIVLINMLVAGSLSWFGWVSAERSDRRGRLVTELSEANRKLTASLEENAGLHAQLLAQAREAGVLDERQRMAREIHDTLAQGLAGIITQLEAAGRAAAPPGPGTPAESGKPAGQWRHHFDSAIRLARESLSEARRSVQALQPEPLEMARLPDALAEVAERWSGRSGVDAQVTTTGNARPMRPEIEMALLRTAQEALANVAKHAHASRVGLTLSYMEDEVALDVRDDGVGFDPAPDRAGRDGVAADRELAVALARAPAARGAQPSGGFGLTAMRQRVEGLAGTLEIESEIGTGTAISASMPAIPAGAGA
jgi:signal transduction histidine kinase